MSLNFTLTKNKDLRSQSLCESLILSHTLISVLNHVGAILYQGLFSDLIPGSKFCKIILETFLISRRIHLLSRKSLEFTYEVPSNYPSFIVYNLCLSLHAVFSIMSIQKTESRTCDLSECIYGCF